MVRKERAPGLLEGKDWSVGFQRKETASTIPVLVEWRGPFMSRCLASPIQSRHGNLCRVLRTMYEANTELMASTSPPIAATAERSVNFKMLEC